MVWSSPELGYFQALNTLTLIWVGFLGVRFEVEGGGGGKITPSKTH